METGLSWFCRCLLVTLCVAVGVSSVPADVCAQDGGDDVAESEAPMPSSEQRKLNDEAVRAIGAKDYTRAISYLEESLYLGELNITYLNLGRAYQLLGQCAKARAAYAKVAEAPAVKKPRAAFVESKAQQYQAELDETCPEQDEAPAADESSQTQAADDVEASEASEVTVGAKEGANEKPQQGADTVERPGNAAPLGGADAGGNAALGWGATVGGLVLVGGGVGLHLWAESVRDEVSVEQAQFDGQRRVVNISQSQVYEHQSKANTLDTVGLSMGIVGGLSTAAGIYLLVTDDAEDGGAVSVGPSSDGAGIVINGRF
ncbi:tetratricopeptide repeat protein [Persicimonas caeni]|uniref:tetratricopeptide repeat protein n=1 Tax=Persicimonas caeni TaxID=2292766 RepID=UPI00143CF28C|nr:tetratricopeptide repeat protein [Persicimonas caeni]